MFNKVRETQSKDDLHLQIKSDLLFMVHILHHFNKAWTEALAGKCGKRHPLLFQSELRDCANDWSGTKEELYRPCSL